MELSARISKLTVLEGFVVEKRDIIFYCKKIYLSAIYRTPTRHGEEKVGTSEIRDLHLWETNNILIIFSFVSKRREG